MSMLVTSYPSKGGSQWQYCKTIEESVKCESSQNEA